MGMIKFSIKMLEMEGSNTDTERFKSIVIASQHKPIDIIPGV